MKKKHHHANNHKCASGCVQVSCVCVGVWLNGFENTLCKTNCAKRTCKLIHCEKKNALKNNNAYNFKICSSAWVQYVYLRLYVCVYAITHMTLTLPNADFERTFGSFIARKIHDITTTQMIIISNHSAATVFEQCILHYKR